MKWILFCFACFVMTISWFSHANTLFHTLDYTDNNFGLSHTKSIMEVELGIDLKDFSKLKEFNVELPGGVDVTISRQNGELKNFFEYHFRGTVKNDPFGRATLISTGKSISGEIMSGGHTYWIFKKGKKYFLVENFELGSGPLKKNDSIALRLNKRSISDPETRGAATSSDRFIDLMIIYTDDVGAADSNATATITAVVAGVNTILEKSCINFRYRLVHIQQVSYVETDDADTDLTALRAGAVSPFDTIHTLRDTHGADLVQLITTASPGLCGLAYIPSPTTNDTLGFSLTVHGCGAQVMAHELAHNIGVAHDRHQEGIGLQEVSNTYKYRYGFVDLVNKQRSIMAYSAHCDEAGVICARVDQFSSPVIRHKGIRFGLDDYVDAVKAHNENLSLIAAYRTAKSSYSLDIKNFCLAKGANSEEEKDIHCFIASAAYGSYMHPEVLKLRNFRDNFLKSTVLGQKFINYYYKFSPPLALKLTQHPALKKLAQILVYGLVFFIDYGAYFIYISLISLITFLLIKRKKNYFGVSSFLLLTLLSSTLINDTQASVSYPSYFKYKLGVNPATRLLISSPTVFSTGAEIKKGTIESKGGLYKEESSETSIALIGGMYTPAFFAEAKINGGGSRETDIHSAPMTDSTSETDISNLEASIGTKLFFLPLGIRMQKGSEEHKKTKYKIETLSMGLGSYLNFYGLQFGFGFDYITEKGNQIAEAKWVESYIGVGTGLVLAIAKFHGEVYVKRRPQVFNYEGLKFNFHPEALTIGFNAEFSGLPFLIIKNFGLNIEIVSEPKTDYFIDKDISRKIIEFTLAGPLLIPNLSWNAALSQSSVDFAHDDSLLEIDLFVSFAL